MEKRKWKSAEKMAKKAKNKSIYNFIQWRHLLTTGNTASFFEYKEFIERNKNYPRMGRVNIFLSINFLQKFYLQEKLLICLKSQNH